MMQAEFNGFVRRRMRELGISLREVARRAGLSRQALYKLLGGGTQRTHVDTVIALADALQVHPIILLRLVCHGKSLPHHSSASAIHRYDGNSLIRDITMPDNSQVLVGEYFVKTWLIQNIGEEVWKNRYYRCVDDELEISSKTALLPPLPRQGLKPDQTILPIPETKPDQTLEISVGFTAPDYPATILSYWKMFDENGAMCFPEVEGLSCLVRVIGI